MFFPPLFLVVLLCFRCLLLFGNNYGKKNILRLSLPDTVFMGVTSASDLLVQSV
jgi:hypothetical protein